MLGPLLLAVLSCAPPLGPELCDGIDNDGDKINIGDYQVDFTGDQQKIDFKLRRCVKLKGISALPFCMKRIFSGPA